MAVVPLPKIGPEHSIERILTLLSRVRLLSQIALSSLIVWELTEIVFIDEELSPSALPEFVAFGMFGPTLIWLTTRWAIGLSKKVKESQQELIRANDVARREIKERVRAEKALSERSHLYQILYQEAPHTYFSSTPDGILQTANKSASVMFGRPQEDFIGMHAFWASAPIRPMEKRKQESCAQKSRADMRSPGKSFK